MSQLDLEKEKIDVFSSQKQPSCQLIRKQQTTPTETRIKHKMRSSFFWSFSGVALWQLHRFSFIRKESISPLYVFLSFRWTGWAGAKDETADRNREETPLMYIISVPAFSKKPSTVPSSFGGSVTFFWVLFSPFPPYRSRRKRSAGSLKLWNQFAIGNGHSTDCCWLLCIV